MFGSRKRAGALLAESWTLEGLDGRGAVLRIRLDEDGAGRAPAWGSPSAATPCSATG